MRRSRRRSTWVAEENRDGTFTVQRNGRDLASGLSEAAVQRILDRKARPGDKVNRQDPDGYKTPGRLSDFREHPGRDESPSRR